MRERDLLRELSELNGSRALSPELPGEADPDDGLARLARDAGTGAEPGEVAR